MNEILGGIWNATGNPQTHLAILLAGFAWLGRRSKKQLNGLRTAQRELKDLEAQVSHLRKIIGWRKQEAVVHGRVQPVLPLPEGRAVDIDPVVERRDPFPTKGRIK
jgi:hypothetical protein